MASQENERIKGENREITFKLLLPFDNHQFAEYTGQQLTDVIESTKAKMVLEPILVRSSEKRRMLLYPLWS
jgi:hypothetical protein